MNKSAIFLLAILSILKISVGAEQNYGINELNSNLEGSRAEILVELGAKVLQLQLNISTTWLAEGNAIQEDKNTIQSDAEAAVSNIQSGLSNLDVEVQNATEEAKKEQKDITDCIRTEEKARNRQVNVNEIKNCVSTKELNILGLKLAKFGRVNAKTSLILPSCQVLHPVNDDKLKECVLNALENDESEVAAIKSDIEAEAQNIVLSQVTCIVQNRVKMNSAIKQISDYFQTCVQNV